MKKVLKCKWNTSEWKHSKIETEDQWLTWGFFLFHFLSLFLCLPLLFFSLSLSLFHSLLPSFPSFLPASFPPFYFLVHFMIKPTKPNQIPKSIHKTCYSSNSRNRLVMTQGGLLQHKYLFNSTVFWLKKASDKPDHQNYDLTDNFHPWSFITLKY